VNGSVVLNAGTVLSADGMSSGGYIIGGAGSVSGEGTVSLPYITGDNPDGYLSYSASTAKKTVGSVVDTDEENPVAGAVTAAVVAGIFNGGAASLTVTGLTDIAAATIPANKELTILGSGNTTASGGLDLSSNAGNLIVGTGAELTVTGSIKAAASNITNNGTITASVSALAGITPLAGLSGAGSVALTLTEAIDASAVTVAAALVQDVTISGSYVLSAPNIATHFSGNGSLTISVGATLKLGADTTAIGVDVTNNGTVETAVESGTALAAIMETGGTINATGAIITLAQALVIPANVVLTATAATLASGVFDVTMNGTATFDVAAVPAGDIIVFLPKRYQFKICG
jgi:hypothetical protein